MSSPNKEIQKHIESNPELLAKLKGLTQQLRSDLLRDFEVGMGIPMPTAAQADIRQLNYAMVYGSDPIFDHYMNVAKQLLDAKFSGDLLEVADKVLNVVRALLNKVVSAA